MNDIKLIFNDSGDFSISFTNGDFTLDNGFDTMIYLLLCTDAEATEDDIQASEKRRGWLGDLNSPIKGRKFGGLLWLVDQRRLNQDTLNFAIKYAKNALQLIVTDKLALFVKVVGDIIPLQGIELTITITSLSGATTNHYIKLWEVTGVA
jgi:phage gp46-like protein